MNYPHNLAVSRKTVVSDGLGGFDETFSIVGALSDVMCHIRQLKADELIVNDKMGVIASHRVYCSGISITTSDQIFVTLYGTTISDLYDVQTINKKVELGSGTPHHFEIDVEVIK